MTHKQLIEGIPTDFYQPKSVEEINSKISVSSGYLKNNFKSLLSLAATMGGTYDKLNKRFRVHVEHNPTTGETSLAKISPGGNVIKRPGMIYESDFARKWAESKLMERV